MLDLSQQLSDNVFTTSSMYVYIILTNGDMRSLLNLIAHCFVTHLVPIQEEFHMDFSAFCSVCVCVFSF